MPGPSPAYPVSPNPGTHGRRSLRGGRPPVLNPGPERRTLSSELTEQLTKARRRSGLSVRQLADLSGISRSMISAVCRGDRCPSRDVAEELAGVLRLEDDVIEALMGEAVVRGWPE